MIFSGKWYEEKFIKRLLKTNGLDSLTANEAIALAAHNCYTTIMEVFQKSGYDIVLLALGDHELGK